VDHLSEHTINEYRQRKLDPAQLLAVDEHLASCDQCHLEWIHSGMNVKHGAEEFYSDLSSPDPATDDHLSYEILEALVDDEANEVDREIAHVHLQLCLQCAGALRTLEELRDEKPVMVTEVKQRAAVSFLHRWQLAAFAVLALVAITAVAWIAFRSQRPAGPGEQHIAVSIPSPANVSSPNPTPTPTVSPEVIASLKDGEGTITLDKSGKLEGVGDLTPSVSAAVKNALSSERLNIAPAIAGLRPRGGTLMGRGSEGVPFKLLSPVGVVIQSSEPTFRWEPYAGAPVYVVKVFDSDFKEVAKSLSQTATSWKVPLSLIRGSVYTWQVTAVKNGEEFKSPTAPAPQVRFKVLAQDRLDEIARVQNSKPVSHLVLGIVYAEAGLLEDARREFRSLSKVNPDSRVIQKLLQELNRN